MLPRPERVEKQPEKLWWSNDETTRSVGLLVCSSRWTVTIVPILAIVSAKGDPCI